MQDCYLVFIEMDSLVLLRKGCCFSKDWVFYLGLFQPFHTYIRGVKGERWKK